MNTHLVRCTVSHSKIEHNFRLCLVLEINCVHFPLVVHKLRRMQTLLIFNPKKNNKNLSVELWISCFSLCLPFSHWRYWRITFGKTSIPWKNRTKNAASHRRKTMAKIRFTVTAADRIATVRQKIVQAITQMQWPLSLSSTQWNICVALTSADDYPRLIFILAEWWRNRMRKLLILWRENVKRMANDDNIKASTW